MIDKTYISIKNSERFEKKEISRIHKGSKAHLQNTPNMKPGKRRRIGLLTKDAGTDESEQETRATIIEQDDEVVVTFGGDTEDELEDEYDDDDVDGQHSSMDSSPLTTRVRIRYCYILYIQTNVIPMIFIIKCFVYQFLNFFRS